MDGLYRRIKDLEWTISSPKNANRIEGLPRKYDWAQGHDIGFEDPIPRSVAEIQEAKVELASLYFEVISNGDFSFETTEELVEQAGGQGSKDFGGPLELEDVKRRVFSYTYPKKERGEVLKKLRKSMKRDFPEGFKEEMLGKIRPYVRIRREEIGETIGAVIGASILLAGFSVMSYFIGYKIWENFQK